MPAVFEPEPGVRIQPGFFALYWADFRLIYRRHGRLCEEKTHEKTTIEKSKMPDESMNKQKQIKAICGLTTEPGLSFT